MKKGPTEDIIAVLEVFIAVVEGRQLFFGDVDSGQRRLYWYPDVVTIVRARYQPCKGPCRGALTWVNSKDS